MVLYTARCYTKSGSIEKYESNLWKGINNIWRSDGGSTGDSQDPYLGSAPDANGNYQIGFRNTIPNVTFYCTTDYGGAIKEFSETYTLPNITVSQISFNGSMIYVNSVTTVNTEKFSLSIPKNCTVTVTNGSTECSTGIKISKIDTIKKTEGEYDCIIICDYIRGSISQYECVSVSVNITVTANDNCTEYTPGSSATLQKNVGHVM